MSGFSEDWLALREPADHRSVNAYVRQRLIAALPASRPLRVVDLGCGAGSNLRGLAPILGTGQHWTLVDYDRALLDTARKSLATSNAEQLSETADVRVAFGNAAVDVAFRQADLSRGAYGEIIGGASLVTAAALFDLVSAGVIDALAEEIAARRQAFYTVLTYDGIAAWLPEHATDRAMRDAFNQHQRTDKGFGPAEGPGATACLAHAFTRRGYEVIRAKSPWVLDESFSALRREVDRGWAAAVRETGLVSPADIDAWLQHRLQTPDAVTVVGHDDILAVPPLR